MAEVRLHPLALSEFQSAVGWYQQRNPSAAERFAAAVERVLRSIGKHPERYGWFDDEFREAAVARYPYSIIYQVRDSGDVYAAAVAHASREPCYWRQRV